MHAENDEARQHCVVLRLGESVAVQSARDRTRTGTTLRSKHFKCFVSTCFTTRAALDCNGVRAGRSGRRVYTGLRVAE